VKSVLSLCTVMACLLNAALVGAADKKQLSAALAAVEANLKTPAGKRYDQELGTQLVKQHAAPAQAVQAIQYQQFSGSFRHFSRIAG
jgi:hypothetical protein